MRLSGSLFFIGSGATLIVSGFVYDLSFAGLPYPDPTAEMQERWLYHKGVSDWIILSGLAFLCAGCIGKAAQWTVNIMKNKNKL